MTMSSHGSYRCRSLLWIGLLLHVPCISAQDAKSILARVAMTYSGLRNYHIEGRTRSETAIAGQISKSEMRFVVAYEAPNRFRIEFRYPNAGNWLRVSDGVTYVESRSIKGEYTRKPATSATLRVLRSSPLAVFEGLINTAHYPLLMRSDFVFPEAGPVDCYLIGFESRRPLRKGEWPGASMVWVDKKNYLVLREDIRTSFVAHGVLSENRSVTEIDFARVNDEIPQSLFIPNLRHQDQSDREAPEYQEEALRLVNDKRENFRALAREGWR
jgi:hypothetical protein